MIFLILLLVQPARALDFYSLDPDQVEFRREGDQLVVENTLKGGRKTQTQVPLQQVPGGKKFYHWADSFSAQRYVADGKISSERMAEMNRIKAEMQEYGPGFYVSQDAFDAQFFGDVSVENHVRPEGFYVIGGDKKHSFKFSTSEKAQRIIAKLSEQGVFGANVNGDNWFTLYDARATSDVRPFNPVEYIKEELPKAEDLPAQVKPVLEKITQGKSLDVEDLFSLTQRGESPFDTNLVKAATMLAAKQEQAILASAPPGDPLRIAHALLQIRCGVLDGRIKYDSIAGAKKQLTTILDTLAREGDPVALKRVQPLLVSVLDLVSQFFPGYEPRISVELAELALQAAKDSPNGTAELLNLLRYQKPSPLPAAMARWVANSDSAFTSHLAGQLGVPEEVAAAFRALLFHGRDASLTAKGAEKILANLEVSKESAMALLRASGAHKMVFAAAARVAGKVPQPSAELVKLVLPGLAVRDYYVSELAVQTLNGWKLGASGLREELLPVLKEWMRGSYELGTKRDFQRVIGSAGITLEEIESAGASSQPVKSDCGPAFAGVGRSSS